MSQILFENYNPFGASYYITEVQPTKSLPLPVTPVSLFLRENLGVFFLGDMELMHILQ